MFSNAFGQSSGLLAWDLFHAEALTRVLTVLSAALPGVTLFLIGFFIVQSLILVFFTDQLYHKWMVRVAMSILLANVALGGLVTKSLNPLKTSASGSLSTDIEKFITFRNPGVGGQPVNVSAYGQSPFEVYAYAGVGDEVFATASGENLCNTQTYSKDEMQVFTFDMNAADNRSDVSFDEAWKAMNSRFQRTPMLSSFLVYLSNSMSSLGFAATKLSEGQIVGEAVQMSTVVPLKNVIDGDGSFSDMYGDEPEGANSFVVYASLGGYDADSVITPLISTTPGGPVGYSTMMWNRLNMGDEFVAAKIVDGDEIVRSIEEDRRPKAVGQNGANGLMANAKTAGFDGHDAGVAPEYYLRTHTDLFIDQCRNDPGIRPGESGGSMFDILDPCRIAVPKPIGRIMGNAGVSVSDVQDGLAGIGDLIDPMVGDLLYDSFSTLSSLSGEIGAIAKVTGLELPVDSLPKCTKALTWEGLIQQYEKMLQSSASQTKANRHCYEMGLNIAQISSAVSKTSKENSRVFENYIYKNSPFALENGAVLALVIGGDDDDDSGEPPDANLADFSDSLRAFLAPLSEGFAFLAPFTNVSNPTAIESNGVAQALEQPNGGIGTAAGAAAITAYGTAQELAGDAPKTAAKKGLVARGIDFFKRAANKAVAVAKSGKQAIFNTVLKGALKGLLSWVMWIVSSVPAAALMIMFVGTYFIVIFTTSLGLAFLPLYSLFSLGKTFNGLSAGDEQYGGVSLFPILTLVLSPMLMSAELAGLGVASGQTTNFFTQATSFMTDMLAGVSIAGLNMINPFATGVVGYPLGFITHAMKPFGIMLGVAMIPVFLAKLVQLQPYHPRFSEGEGGSPIHTAGSSVKLGGSNFMASGILGAGSKGSDAAAVPTAEKDATTLDGQKEALAADAKTDRATLRKRL